MDNKKWYKRISTCFWFLLATLPIWVALFAFIGQYIAGYPELFRSNTQNSWLNYFSGFGDYLVEVGDSGPFKEMALPFIYDMFVDLFDTYFQINGAYNLAAIFSWFVSVYFYELLVDFIVWLPKFFHSLLDKGVGKID